MTSRGAIEPTLQAKIDAGGKVLVPYITGGFPGWQDAMGEAAAAGADAIEIGIPFSDPVMDGPTIQEANDLTLEKGVTPAQVIEEAARLDIDIPLAVMTYYNVAFRFGLDRFAETLIASGISGAILPDMPLEEAGPWEEAAGSAGVEPVYLVAPTTPDDRAQRIIDRGKGFVYAVGLLGITGVRDELAATAVANAARCKSLTNRPVLVGVGVGTPAQAAEVVKAADGCVVGSAIVRQLLDNGPSAVGELVGQLRAAIDA